VSKGWWEIDGALRRVLAVANKVPIGERSLNVGVHRLYADSVDRFLALASWKLGLGERKERALIERVVTPGMIALDVGANIGLHTLGLAERVGPGGRVHAIEPDPDNFRLLVHGVKHARVENVRLHQLAASDRKGTLTLYVSAANRGDHRTAPAAEERRSFTLSAVSLDELLAGEPRVDFVKIDVQGAEVQVLRGLRETLRRSPGTGVLCELCPELLRRAGTTARELFGCFEEARLAPHRILATGNVERVAEHEATAAAERSGYVNLYFKG